MSVKASFFYLDFTRPDLRWSRGNWIRFVVDGKPLYVHITRMRRESGEDVEWEFSGQECQPKSIFSYEIKSFTGRTVKGRLNTDTEEATFEIT